jgi:hypothetical protein
MASVPSIKRESIPGEENICWKCTTAQIDVAKAVAQGEEADSDLVSMTSWGIGRTLRRFPEKVIPLYSADHDDYASKGHNEVETTK